MPLSKKLIFRLWPPFWTLTTWWRFSRDSLSRTLLLAGLRAWMPEIAPACGLCQQRPLSPARGPHCVLGSCLSANYGKLKLPHESPISQIFQCDNTVCAFSVFHGGQCEQRWVPVLLNLQRIISLFNAVIWWVFQNYLCLPEVQLESMSLEPHRPGSIQSLPVYQSDPGQVTPTPQCALYSADGDSTCLRARMRTRWTSWRKNFASSLTHL